jgi:hypothetical protein
MTFNELAWSAVCFYYRSVADRRYCNIISNTNFIMKLRQTPFEIDPMEFEQKVLLDYVKIENYDLLVGHKMAQCLLEKIIGLQPTVSSLKDLRLAECDLLERDINERIKRIYSILHSADGLFLTGASKIAHLLNDKLFVPMNFHILDHFHINDSDSGFINWLTIMQDSSRQVIDDFHEKGFSGTPEAFLSEKLGYLRGGCHKSLIKYLDEYYWLLFADLLPIPPIWIPQYDPFLKIGSRA